jgi:beta-1,4-mannooligosaccharide/beta-1,4-mannosyl-N-acetylglucosamine phosphorylase
MGVYLLSKVNIIGNELKNMPWQDKPNGYEGIVWRHEGNPIINWNPTKKTARVFNSAVIPYKDGFVGVFRADHKNGKALLHTAHSKDALNWDIVDEEIHWIDENGKPFETSYAYDPRLVKIDDIYYIIWCTDFGGGPTLGLGMTKDFITYTRLENAFIPCNRNGVLFPRRIDGKYLLLSRPSDTGHTPFGDIFISESSDLCYWVNTAKLCPVGDQAGGRA